MRWALSFLTLGPIPVGLAMQGKILPRWGREREREGEGKRGRGKEGERERERGEERER